jgi:HlyD family secretion protein
MRTPTVLLVGCALIAAAITGGLAFFGEHRNLLPSQPLAAGVDPAVRVARGIVDVDGGLIQIAASRDGVAREVLVNEGDRVRKGDVLLIIDDRTARMALMVAEAELAEAKAALRAIEIRLASAEREVARYDRLVVSRAAAQAQLDEQRDELSTAAADLAYQRSVIETARARRASAETEVAERTIRAPVDGEIVRRQVQPGDGISTLNVTTLFWLAPATPAIVRAEVEELLIENIRVGQRAEVRIDGDETRRFFGTVSRVGAVFVPRRASLYDPRDRADIRVVEAIIACEQIPSTIRLGQRVIVSFLAHDEAAPAPQS